MSHVLVVGGGAREHAIAWKLLRSPKVSRVSVAPGNDGMGVALDQALTLDSGKTIARISCDLKSETGFHALADRCIKDHVALTVIGPDDPLALGIADIFQAKAIPVFGPSKAAAKLEWSKQFTKEVLEASGVKTPKSKYFTDLDACCRFLETAAWSSGSNPSWVIKADGLALGKGVILCRTKSEGVAAAKVLYHICRALLVEEFLEGEEVSWLAICEDESFRLFDPAQDYKKLKDGDQGPNTGGMGGYSPVEKFNHERWFRDVSQNVFKPVLREMTKRGTPFRGVLYAGLMFVPKHDAFYVLEFNARFGDPEAQVLLPRLREDLFEVLSDACHGNLKKHLNSPLTLNKQSSVYVVAASPGYPEAPKTGAKIRGLVPKWDLEEPEVFSAGVSLMGKEFVTSGGRVIGAFGLGATKREAKALAYQVLDGIEFEGKQFRRDIGGSA